MTITSRTKTIIAASTLLLAGFGGGAAVMVLSSASADETSASSSSTDAHGGSGETALTGDTLTKVTDAVLAEYPGATIDRAETDNGGVYEAHITTAGGDDLTVLVDEEFAISGTETGGHGDHGGHGGGAGETPLTGTTLTKVTDAVLAEYPGATIDRAETDNGGVYEAHITSADGDDLTVLVDEDFTVTGTDTGH
jgi:uncharacterized membrane protein YkoI